ncbi:LysR family transcriptional regulator [Pontibacterium sp.]|uniref:LysR family transcriptional regulator n=1 Tax=Pontibacterium sp. TaxID=2036026 RepID=UPI003512165A
MQNLNLRTLDLNLLIILQTLLEVRHVTRASEKLNMSQPKVSRALQKLRDAFNDPLLVRTLDGYDLSARAERLLPELNQIMGDLERMVAQESFDPATSRDRVKVYAVDLEVVAFLPQLLTKLRQHAPHMMLDIRSEPRDHFDLLAEGDVHFSLSGRVPTVMQDQYRMMPLAQSNMVCMMSSNHRLAGQQMTLEDYLGCCHGYVSITNEGPAMIDTYMSGMGKSRQLTTRLPNFTSAAYFCESSDLVVAIPEIIAQMVAKGHDVTIQPLPSEITLPPTQFNLYWHERYHNDPMCRWVRRVLLGH